MKKIRSLILTGILTTFIPITVNANTITQKAKIGSKVSEQSIVRLDDIKSHWAEIQIQEFLDLGYISGYEDGTFKPNKQITRAEFIHIVNKVFEYERVDKNYTLNYKDVNKTQWFYEDILIANREGYITGYEDNTFRPGKNITRQEVAKVISRIKGFRDDNTDKMLNYNDYENVSEWASSNMEYCLEKGFIVGDEKHNINPKSHITRAEVVVMLNRVKNGGRELPTFESKYDKVCEDLVKKLDGQLQTDEYGNEIIIFENSPEKIYLYSDIMYMNFEDEMDDHFGEIIKLIIGNEEETEQFFKIFKLKKEKGLLDFGSLDLVLPEDEYRGIIGIFSDVQITLMPRRLGGFTLTVR